MNPRNAGLGPRAGLILCLVAGPAFAADTPSPPLHERVDQIIDGDRVGPAVALAGDAEFLRRVSLDLTGMPPSPDELKAFLADPRPGKRAVAVDRLLESPLFSRQLATNLDLMLMERRPNQNVTADEWQNYLVKACRENRPLNLLMGDVLNADGTDAALRPAARFYLDRGAEPNLITRDVARIFFGRDLQCAQCHNHPLIDDYQQSDYHGLLAFYSPAYALARKEGGKEKTVYAEKAGDDLNFESVFVKNDRHLTGPRILGETEMPEPVFPPGEEYRVRPAENVLPIPKFSRRARLASVVTGGTNLSFNENLANRLWAMMMGRGLVHPLDLHHPANPPSHPELLSLLANELVALKFDARAFLRDLALSQAYQRAIDLPTDLSVNAGEIASRLAELKTHTETLAADSKAAKAEYDRAVKAWHEAETTLVPAVVEQDQAFAKHSAVVKKEAEARKGVNDTLARITSLEDTSKTLTDAAARAQEAVKKLPNEKDLAAAAKKFVDRSKAMTAELASLRKTSADKAVALKKAVDEMAAAVKPVESARAKALPLREAVREKERVVLSARKKMAASRVSLEHHKKSLHRLETYARRVALAEQAVAAAQAVASRREAVARSEKIANETVAVLTRRRAEVSAADQARLVVETLRIGAEVALERQRKVETSVVEAFKATDAAREQLPDDPTLTETALKLKTKVDEVRSISTKAKRGVDLANAKLKPLADALGVANRRLTESVAEKSRADDAVNAARTALADEEARSRVLASEINATTDLLSSLLSDDFQLAQLKPLSPEQICWSVLKVTGVYDRFRQAEEAELNKSKPLAADAKTDPAQVRARAMEVEDRTYAKLKGNLAPFVSVYAAGAGQPQNDFFATADQALFVANAGFVNGWIAPAAGNVTDRLIKEKDIESAAEDLYLTVLSRRPTAEESAEVARVFAEQSPNKPMSVQEWVWALLTSAEFRFNH